MLTSLPNGKHGNLRIDIIEPTEILEHAVAEIHVISRFTTKQSTLLSFQPWWTMACFPSHEPMMPGRGEGWRKGVTPAASYQGRGSQTGGIEDRSVRAAIIVITDIAVTASRSESSTASVVSLAHWYIEFEGNNRKTTGNG